MESSIQVMSVQSDNESRLNLQSSLTDFRDVELVGHASDSNEALNQLRDKKIDVVLLDAAASHMNSVELTRQIRKEFSNVRLIVITASDQPEDIFAAMDAGTDGYILKGNISKALGLAIRSVRLGAVWLDPAIAQQVLLVMEMRANTPTPSRVLPTGIMTIPLLPEEKTILHELAASSCVDGVCMVDPSFVAKLRRYTSAQ